MIANPYDWDTLPVPHYSDIPTVKTTETVIENKPNSSGFSSPW
jgi:hypothetical protein